MGMTTRKHRAAIAAELAVRHSGVMHRSSLRDAGVTHRDVQLEVQAGRWRMDGRHTVVAHNGDLSDRALLWRAVWESGSGAVLDGAASLVAWTSGDSVVATVCPGRVAKWSAGS